MHVDYKGFDLTANLKGKTKALEFPSVPVEVSIDIPYPDKKLDPLLQQKMQDATKAKLVEIQNLFTKEMLRIDEKLVNGLKADPSKVDMKGEQTSADVMGKQIANTIPAHVQQACDKVLADLGKAHKELIKYRVKCAIKIAWAGVKLSVAAARLGASHGADVSAWISAGKEIYAIGTVIYELAKTADTVLKEVGKEYETLIKAVAKVKAETKGIKIAARQIGDVEPKCKKVEEKLGVLRPKVTGVDEKSHGLAQSLDKLLNAVEKSKKELNPKALAKVPAMEAKINVLITKIEGMQVKVQDMRKYADAVQLTIVQFRADYTKAAGTTVKVVDFLTKCKEVYDQAKEVIDVVKDIVELAA